MVWRAFSKGLASCCFHDVTKLFAVSNSPSPLCQSLLWQQTLSHLSHKQKKLLEHFPEMKIIHESLPIYIDFLEKKIVIDGMLLSQNILSV